MSEPVSEGHRIANTSASTPERAAAYIRKSSKPDSQQQESFDGQRRCIEDFARAHGYRIVRWYREAESGTDAKSRKVFQRMLEDVRGGGCEFRYLICYDVSRFGRMETDEAGHLRHELRRNGVEVLYASPGLQSRAEDDLIVPTRQWLAREYSLKLAEYISRSKATRLSLAVKGEAVACKSGPPPYGYDLKYFDAGGNAYAILRCMPGYVREILDPDGRPVQTLPKGVKFSKAMTDYNVLVPSLPERVDVVRRVYEWYADGSQGMWLIAQRLNEMLARKKAPAAPRGGLWSLSTVRRILADQTYAGDTAYGTTVTGKFYTVGCGRAIRRTGSETRRKPTKPREEWTVIEGTHEAIVAPDLFRRAQERLKAKRKTFPARAPGSRYIFSGKLRCGECGYAYVGRRYCGGRVQGYICSNYVAGGKTACRIGSVKEEEMEKAVGETISGKLRELVACGALRCGRGGPGPAATARRSRIKDQVRHLDARLERLLRCITPLNKHPVSEKMLAAVAEKKRVLRMREEPGKASDPTWSATDRELLRKFSADFQRKWAGAEVEEKRRIVSALVDRIEIHAQEKRLRLWWSDSCPRLDESDAQDDDDREGRQQNTRHGSCIDLSLPGGFRRRGPRESHS